VLRLRVAGKDRLQLLVGEGIEALDPHDREVALLVAQRRRDQVVVDLAAAQDHAANGHRAQ